MIAFAGHTQSSSKDTICLDRKTAAKVYQAALEGKAYKEQRDLLINENDTLKARIVIKESIIATQNGKILDLNSIINSKNAIISAGEDKVKAFSLYSTGLENQLKKQKHKTKAAAFLGLLTTGIVTYFFITK